MNHTTVDGTITELKLLRIQKALLVTVRVRRITSGDFPLGIYCANPETLALGLSVGQTIRAEGQLQLRRCGKVLSVLEVKADHVAVLAAPAAALMPRSYAEPGQPALYVETRKRHTSVPTLDHKTTETAVTLRPLARQGSTSAYSNDALAPAPSLHSKSPKAHV